MATDRFIPRVESYRGYLRVLAYSLMQRSSALRGKLDVSDIVQDVLLQAHTALTQFQGKTEGELKGGPWTIISIISRRTLARLRSWLQLWLAPSGTHTSVASSIATSSRQTFFSTKRCGRT